MSGVDVTLEVVQTQITLSIETKTVDLTLSGVPGPAGADGTDGSAYDPTTDTIHIKRLISSTSSPTTAGNSASTDYVYLVSGSTTITLPTAIGNTNKYSITNVGVGLVTVATTSSQTINGSTTATLPIPNMSLDFISNNTNWVVE